MTLYVTKSYFKDRHHSLIMFSKKSIFFFSQLFIVLILLMNLVTNNRSIHITHNMQSNIKTVWFFEFMNLQVVCIVVVAMQLLLRQMFYCCCVRSFTRRHQSGNPRTYFHNHRNTCVKMQIIEAQMKQENDKNTFLLSLSCH